MIIFFILVDILPVTWKGLTAKGPYDEYLNEIEFSIKNEVQAKMIDSETKLAMHKQTRERDRVIHTNNIQAAESISRN